MKKLYKFRSLGSPKDLERAQKILKTGKFWCSRFWELNDPMEGVYRSYANAHTEKLLKKLYDEKSRRVLCSFSGEKALENPIMWGYYANGFKGVAIEIEVDCDQSDIVEVQYKEDVPTIEENDHADEAVKRILTTKLCCWEHENEHRYLSECNHNHHKIGDITAVFFGAPYETIVNSNYIANHSVISEYSSRADSLRKTAEERKTAENKKIDCFRVVIENGEVKKKDDRT